MSAIRCFIFACIFVLKVNATCSLRKTAYVVKVLMVRRRCCYNYDMAKIYVAGYDLKRSERVMNLLRERGHTITYDWVTDYSEDDETQKAFDEREGVRDADILV